MILAAFASLIPSALLMVVWLVGIGLALTRLRAHRRSSSLLAAGLAGLLVQRLVMSPVMTFLPTFASGYGWSMTAISTLYAAIGLVEGVFSALWFSMIIGAVVVKEEP